MMDIQLGKQTIRLLLEKAIFIPKDKILVIADLHLGKAAHFRKSGLALPLISEQADYQLLNQMLIDYQPEKVWFLGDLFHSEKNNSWDVFINLIQQYSNIQFSLIKGNHDIINMDFYAASQIKVYAHGIQYHDLLFTHEPLSVIPEGVINIAGHIHPGYSVRGMGKQKITLPCFYKRSNSFLLPAFGYLTGLYILKKEMDVTVYILTPTAVIQM